MSKLGGYCGKILRVNLSEERVKEERVPEERLRKFIGGTTLAISYLYESVPPGVAPLEPENVLIFMTGPLIGTPVPGAVKYSVVAKSPLTNLVGIARSSGYWAPELKFAGYDGIIIEGASEKPVYLWINDGKAEIRDASDLWGKDCYEVEETLKRELNDEKVRVASIGPAGEVLSKIACIMNDCTGVGNGHAAGRSGLGAVMGSKKLKAIAVRGTGEIPVADEEKVKELAKEFMTISKEKATEMRNYGTAGSYEGYERRNLAGDLPTKNWTESQFDEWRKLCNQYLQENYKVTKTTCYRCPVGHDFFVEIDGKRYSAPEYETTAAFGCNLGNSDTEAIVKLGDLANRYGLDTIELSNTISAVMEAYEKGLLTEKDLDGLKPTWGNMEVVKILMDKIVKREGIGDVLAEGAREAGDRLGISDLVVHIKGQSPILHDLRHHWGWMASYIVAASGGNHEGIATLEGIPNLSVKGIGKAVKNQQIRWWGYDAFGMCWHAANSIPPELVYSFLAPVTGWDVSIEEFKTAIERGITLARAFNILHGLDPERDDRPPKKLLEPPRKSPVEGISPERYIKAMVVDYYQNMGWDVRTGKPLRSTLRRLGLENVIDDIW